MSPGAPDSPDRSCQEPVSTARRHKQFADVNNILEIKNGLNTLTILNLLLQFKVRVWRKKKGWQGLYKLIIINS